MGKETRSGPLAGVKVVDATRLLPGCTCTWILATLGAEVIKVEDCGVGDYTRDFGIQVEGQGAPHHLVNRAKRSIVLDLKDDSGREAFRRLVSDADVLVESFRPGVMDRLGFGPRTLLDEFPALVYASLSGFGADGPLSAFAGHDINYEALSGYLDMTGVPGGPPILPPIPIADLVGGALLPTICIISLVMQSRSLGRGGHIDAAMAEGMALLPNMVVADVLAGGVQATRGTHEHTGVLASYRVYPLRDGHVAIGSLEPKFWAALCEGLEAPDLLEKQQEDQEWLAIQIADRFSLMTKEEVRLRFSQIDACVTVVESYSSFLDSDLARQRGLVRRIPGFPMPLLAPPFVIDGERPPETLPAPRRGEHSREVLLEIGFSEAEIERMATAGTTLVL